MRMKVGGAFFRPCGVTNQSQSIPLGTHCCERNVALSHEDLIETIRQIDRAVDDAARHVVEDHAFPRNGRLCRNGSVV
jgi:hypothetical protein